MLMEQTTTRRRPAQPDLPPPSALVAWDREPERCALLRIWEIDPDALFIVLAMLLDRSEIEALFAEIERDDRSAIREDVLMRDVLARCTRPCRFAEHTERLLDGRTGYLRKRLAQCPMIELAEWWSRAQNREGGPDLGAFCWSLASDPRCWVADLRRRVLGEVAVRALRQFARVELPNRAATKGNETWTRTR